jgi:O-antigen/teichoic acid export membrane protein
LLPVLLASTFLPSLSRDAHVSLNVFFEHAGELIRNAGIGFSLLAAALYIFSSGTLHLLYGDGYSAAVPVLRCLLIGFLVMSFNLILMHVLIALDKEKQLVGVAGLLCASHIAACALLIPRHGIMGACYALIIGEVIYLAAQSFLIVRIRQTL